MNEIQSDRWDRWLRKLFDIRSGAVAPTLAPELVPTIAVEPEDRPENEYIREHRLYFSYATCGAIEGSYSFVFLVNDSDDRLVICERIIASSSFVVSVMDRCGLAYWELSPAAQTPVARDSRYYLAYRNSAGALHIAVDTAIHLPEGWLIPNEWNGFINVPWEFPVPLVIAPHDAVVVRASPTNVEITASFSWREREYELGEYSPPPPCVEQT